MCWVLAAILVSGLSAHAGTVVFDDNFDNGLNNWFYRADYVPLEGAQISSDSDSSRGNVLSFNLAVNSGHIFSNMIFTVPDGGFLRVSFDYKGIDDPSGIGSGGYIGISDIPGTPGPRHTWLFAADNTFDTHPATQHLIDNVGWTTYSVDLYAGSPIFTYAGREDYSGIGFRLMLEDVYSPTGNAYFDNIKVESVPEPSSLSLLVAGGAVLMAAKRRRLV